MAKLSDPNVVTVYDASEAAGELHVAMELIADCISSLRPAVIAAAADRDSAESPAHRAATAPTWVPACASLRLHLLAATGRHRGLPARPGADRDSAESPARRTATVSRAPH